MPSKKLPKVGDRVNLEGRDGVFFVLHVDGESRCVSLLSDGNGPILKEISADSLAIIPRPGPNGATSA